MARPLKELTVPGWAEALADVEDQIYAMGDFLCQELVEGCSHLPAGGNMLHVFSRPPADVWVLIVGQDLYPTSGHTAGLLSSVVSNVRPIPRSLQNIYQELNADLGIPSTSHDNLSAWFEQDALLLNRVLTVSPGKAGSYRDKGWEAVTTAAIIALAECGGPLAAILWGRSVQPTRPLSGQAPVIASAHPSPPSAYNGFLESGPFGCTNETLISQGADPANWDPNNT